MEGLDAIKQTMLGGFDKQSVLEYIEKILLEQDAQKKQIEERELMLSSLLVDAEIKANKILKDATEKAEHMIQEANVQSRQLIATTEKKCAMMLHKTKHEEEQTKKSIKEMIVIINQSKKYFDTAANEVLNYFEKTLR